MNFAASALCWELGNPDVPASRSGNRLPSAKYETAHKKVDAIL
jgi:hypothetical protein